MLKSSGAMGAATLASRLLGMVREIVYARFMGDSWVASAFVLALMIPSLFRRLLGEGALTAAFIPIFKAKEKTAGEAEMWKAANAVISGLVAVGAILTGVAIYGVSTILLYDFTSGETRLMLDIARSILIAAERREETRGAQMREDFPETREDWRANLVLTKGQDGITCEKRGR